MSSRILQSMSLSEVGGYADVLLMQALEGIVRTDVARAEAASAGLIEHAVARLHSEHPPIISSSCVILKYVVGHSNFSNQFCMTYFLILFFLLQVFVRKPIWSDDSNGIECD